jgi:DNA repair photolyase
VNPFMGCALNCTYCYIHGSVYGGEETSVLQVKTNAPEVLYKQLKNRARKGEYGFIGLGSSTDPYPPMEKELEITRELLKIIYRFKFPVNVNTKSTLILRDMELLKKIDEKAVLPKRFQGKLDHGMIVSFSFSTVDPVLVDIFEPGASTVEERFGAMKKFSDEGFLVGANLMPVLPFLSDSEEHLDEAIGKIKEYGANFVLVAGLTLFGDKPNDCKVRYYKILEEYFPEVLEKTKRMFKDSFAPSRDYQAALHKRSERICRKYDIKSKII